MKHKPIRLATGNRSEEGSKLQKKSRLESVNIRFSNHDDDRQSKSYDAKDEAELKKKKKPSPLDDPTQTIIDPFSTHVATDSASSNRGLRMLQEQQNGNKVYYPNIEKVYGTLQSMLKKPKLSTKPKGTIFDPLFDDHDSSKQSRAASRSPTAALPSLNEKSIKLNSRSASPAHAPFQPAHAPLPALANQSKPQKPAPLPPRARDTHQDPQSASYQNNPQQPQPSLQSSNSKKISCDMTFVRKNTRILMREVVDKSSKTYKLLDATHHFSDLHGTPLQSKTLHDEDQGDEIPTRLNAKQQPEMGTIIERSIEERADTSENLHQEEEPIIESDDENYKDSMKKDQRDQQTGQPAARVIQSTYAKRQMTPTKATSANSRDSVLLPAKPVSKLQAQESFNSPDEF